MDRRQLFQYLQFKTFTNDEIGIRFDDIVSCTSTISTTTTGIGDSKDDRHDDSKDDRHDDRHDDDDDRNTTKTTTTHNHNHNLNERNLTKFIHERIKDIDSKRRHQRFSNSNSNSNSNLNSNEHHEHHDGIINNDQQKHKHQREEDDGVSPYSNKKEEQMKSFASLEAKRIIQLLKQQGLKNDDETLPPSLLLQQQQQQLQQQQQYQMEKHIFISKVNHLASKIDTTHTIPISLSMLLVGSSVGIVIPIMPYVVSNLGLSAGQYGMVVSSFAFAKLFANVPSAVMVEAHGRKPYLVYSMVIIAFGVGGIGLADQFEHLVLCRFMTGIGVSALSTAATLSIADCSTPLNRATTMAPLMSSFAAGTAMGPVIGGTLADQMGIDSTFYLVGCIYLSLTAINHFVLTETKMKEQKFPWEMEEEENEKKNQATIIQQISNDNCKKGTNILQKNKKDTGVMNAMVDAMSQWSPLLKDEKVRNVVVMNGFYWVALAGSQMTLLPLILTNADGLAFTATQVGQVYMGMSLVQVMGNPVIAPIIDKIGKVTGIVAGCTFLSTAMFALPYCTEMNEVVGTCGIWALGSTILSTAPIAYISDNVSDSKRAQAIALFRTAGDIGFLCGAISTGAVADAFNMDIAVHSNAGMLLTATGWFIARSVLTNAATKDNDSSKL
jgi:MFS family permease